MFGFLVMSVMAIAHAHDDTIVTAFDAETALDWYVVNDNVMGGRSDGGFEISNDRLTFTGSLNTNGGGFASVRTRPRNLELKRTTAFVARALGDGRTYKLRVMTRDDDVAYSATFATSAGRWETHVIDLAGFVPTRRGRVMQRPPLAPAEIVAVGFMIADKTDGPFRLEVDWLRARPT